MRDSGVAGNESMRTVESHPVNGVGRRSNAHRCSRCRCLVGSRAFLRGVTTSGHGSGTIIPRGNASVCRAHGLRNEMHLSHEVAPDHTSWHQGYCKEVVFLRKH